MGNINIRDYLALFHPKFPIKLLGGTREEFLDWWGGKWSVIGCGDEIMHDRLKPLVLEHFDNKEVNDG